MSGQVEAAPIISEAAFAQPGNQASPQKPAAADAKPVKPAHLKGRHSKLMGLLSVMGMLLLASVALFFTYRSYQASYQKVQKSRVSNSIAPTTVDLGGLAPTSTTLQGVGLLQVNGDANITNSVTANSFSGGGADLSNLNATNITSGTLSDARLSPNVALLDANQAFTGSNSFGGSSNFTGSTNFTGAVVLPGTLTINSLTYNMPGSQAAGTLANDGTGNLIWQAAGACPTCVNTGGNSFGAAMSVGTNDPFDLSFRTNGITRLTFDTAGNATFAGTIVGNGSGITNLNGSNISSGTVADARLTSNVTLQGNLFNGAFQLVQLGAAGQLPALNGAALTNLDASNISAGTLSDSRLSANVTLQGNTFNAANKLVQLNGTGGLPALNGSLLTALNASNISSGTVADARLSTNVALLNANQTFSGTNAFSAGITTNTIATTTGLTVGTTSQSLALQGNGSTTLASNSGGFVTTVGFSGAPVGNVNYNFDAATAAGTYGICTTVGNCASSGGGVTTLGGTTNKVAKFTGLQSIGDGSITDTGTQVTTQSTSTDSASAFRVLNAAGTTTAFNVDTTNTRIGVGTATPSYTVDAVGDINASNGLWVAGNQVCNNTGCIAATGSGFYINNGTGTQATANFNIQSAGAGSIGGVIKGATAQTANLQEWQSSAGTTLASVSAAGTINTASQYQVAGVQIASSDLSNNANLAKLDATQSFTGINTFQNTVNSTGAFKIQNAAGSSNLLVADTTNTRIGIGTASPGYTLDVNGDVNISTGSLYRINGVAICGATGTCAPSALSTFYIQNGTGQQASANFNIVSTATGSITGVLQGAVGQTADLLSLRAGDGTIVAGFSNVGVLTLGNDNGTPQAGSIVIHDNTGSNTFTSTIGTAALTASRTITFPNETGTVCTTAASSACNSSSTGYFQNGGNSFGTTATLGTNDAQALAFETGGITRFTVGSGSATLTGTGATNITTTNTMTVGSSLSTTNITAGTNVALNPAATGILNLGINMTTGSINMGTAMTTGAITIGGAGNSGTVDIRTTNNTSGALNLQTGNNSTITIQTGTAGNLDLLAQTVNIANTTGIKTINLANSTGANIVAIGGTGANTITIGNTQTAGSIAMGAAMTTGTIALGGSSMTTGNINLTGGTGAGAISLQAGAAGTILFGTVNNNAITTGTGVLTVAGDANLNGNTTIGNATSDRLTVTSQILGATPLAFQGLTDNAFYTSFAITDPTALNTVTFRDAGGTVCFESSANCGFQTSGSYFAQGGNSFGTTATLGTNDAQALAFETGGTTRFTVDSGAATLTGTGATTLTSSGAMTLNSAAGSALAIGATSTTGTITIGGANSNTGTISIGGVSTLAVAETTSLNLGPQFLSAAAVSITSGYLLGVPYSTVNIGNTLMQNINIGTGATTPGTVNIGTGTGVQTLSFGTGGTGAKTVALGSSASTGATTINAGTGGIVLAGNVSGNVTFLKESAHTISIDQSTTAATVGGALSIVAGRGSNTTSGIGGALNLTGGAAGSTTGQGGAVVITGGASTGASTAGAASLKGGDGLVGGAATVSGGTGFAGGALTLSGGVGSAGAGGAITITAGTGTTTPGNISITTSTTTTNGVTITANSSTTGVAAVVNSTAAGRTNTAFNIVATGSNSESISIADSGNTCTGNPGATFAWTCSSDQRLKTNIEDSQSILAGLSSLQVRAFDWITNNTHEKYGVVAQEVESTELSWLVKTDPETGLKSVTTPDAFMLIKGIQELNTKVDASAAGLSASVLQTLATANAITINGTLTINGVTIFNGNAKFNGDITVNQDGAGEATIVAGASSVDVVFSKELAAIPVVTASPQDFIDGQYKITNVTKNGFTIRTSTNQTSDVKFSWTSVQK